MTSPANHAMAWREALAGMRPNRQPCPGIPEAVWPAMRDRALDFLDAHGAHAVTLGWTVEDLFGVHPELGTLRHDYAGALVTGAGATIMGFDENRLWRGPMTFYRCASERVKGIPIWQFKG